MTSKSLALSALSLFLLPGCTGKFDGPWLIQWDLKTRSTQSTCDVSEDQYLGDHYEWMDAYTTTGGAVVLTNGDEEYVGTASGTSFDVEAEYFEVLGSTFLNSSSVVTTINRKKLLVVLLIT